MASALMLVLQRITTCFSIKLQCENSRASSLQRQSGNERESSSRIPNNASSLSFSQGLVWLRCAYLSDSNMQCSASRTKTTQSCFFEMVIAILINIEWVPSSVMDHSKSIAVNRKCVCVKTIFIVSVKCLIILCFE